MQLRILNRHGALHAAVEVARGIQSAEPMVVLGFESLAKYQYVRMFEKAIR